MSYAIRVSAGVVSRERHSWNVRTKIVIVEKRARSETDWNRSENRSLTSVCIYIRGLNKKKKEKKTVVFQPNNDFSRTIPDPVVLFETVAEILFYTRIINTQRSKYRVGL